MLVLSHILGFPRVGLHRELKKAQENYWNGNISKKELLRTGRELRARHWKQQKTSGIDLLPVGDFAWYDHVLSMSMMLDNIPIRHRNVDNTVDIDTLFRMGRGCAPKGKSAPASEMTKWFNTNYHYIVPEFTMGQNFRFVWTQLLDEVDEALSLGYRVKPVLIGPVTYLWLGKEKGNKRFDRLSLLSELLPVYKKILEELAKRKIDWVQMDEPALVLELPQSWCEVYYKTYHFLQTEKIKILLTTYFDSIRHQLDIISALPVQGLHVDLVNGDDNLNTLHHKLPNDFILSAGVINGRNIWRANLKDCFEKLVTIIGKRELWVGSSCSLLHSPIDLNTENLLDPEMKSWFSFGIQKCAELGILCTALNSPDNLNQIRKLEKYSAPLLSRNGSIRVHNPYVKERMKNIPHLNRYREKEYTVRASLQRERLNLPSFPTTTIGSFPQTKEIRALRLGFKRGIINEDCYHAGMREHIQNTITEQERLGLDVFVHGEAERNDMVEYFGEHLDGFLLTQNGWVQSYGSRCVKPPIIFGDISRPKEITVEWARYAQSLTDKPVKGMLTGPVTMMCWSFPREDISRKTMSQQIALALRDEVVDLEKSGIGIIQIDEPALREGLPLKRSMWNFYLKWAVESFQLNSSVVKLTTQIHTHMCYCDFHDIIDSIATLDVDVITLETARSDMELLEIFNTFEYPNAIGPGIYDIHSPNIPSEKQILRLLCKAARHIPSRRLWVNPDCGLKTREWSEIRIALTNMVNAAKSMRKMKM